MMMSIQIEIVIRTVWVILKSFELGLDLDLEVIARLRLRLRINKTEVWLMASLLPIKLKLSI